MMLMLAAPALNKGRVEVDKRRCQDNLRVLSQAQLMFANANGGFPPMALAWNNMQYAANQPGPGAWRDGHGWYSLIGPYIGEPAWAATINYTRSMSSSFNEQARRGGLRLKVYACPADIGLQRSEWGSSTWARVLGNYVVNAGNTNYGQQNVPWDFLGAPFAGGGITPSATVTDGLSNTLLMSEKVVIRGCSNWVGSYPDIQTALSTVADGIGYGRNGNGDCGNPTYADARYIEAGVVPVPIALPATPGFDAAYSTYLSARSKHPGGVNASMCDGSAGFVANSIDPAVWRALSTARGAE
jgi:prepilin-type processing-associated H-X9-DG protein